MMKQFFRGSGLAIFFHGVIAFFTSCYMTYTAQAAEAERAAAEYWGWTENDGGTIIDASGINRMEFCIVIALMLVNIFVIVSHWSELKSGEIRARIISGGSPARVIFRLILNYGAIVTAASVAGIALCAVYLGLNLSTMSMRFFGIEIKHILLLCALLAFIGTVAGAAIIWKTYKEFTRR